MRIETESGDDIPAVVLYLTLDEARELRDGLEDMNDERNQRTNWHAHVMSADGQVEVTVAWHELPAH